MKTEVQSEKLDKTKTNLLDELEGSLYVEEEINYKEELCRCWSLVSACRYDDQQQKQEFFFIS